MPVASAFTIGEYVDMDKGVQLAEGGIVFGPGVMRLRYLR